MWRRLKEEDGHGLRRSKPLLLESCSDCQENPSVTTHDTYRIYRKVNMIVIYVALRQNARGNHIRSLQLARSFGEGEIESITITARKVWQSLPVVVGESWRELGVCAPWYPSKAFVTYSPQVCAVSQRLHSPQNRATSLGTSIQTLSPREECSDSNHSK